MIFELLMTVDGIIFCIIMISVIGIVLWDMRKDKGE
jgi:hypothetical protein